MFDKKLYVGIYIREDGNADFTINLIDGVRMYKNTVNVSQIGVDLKKATEQFGAKPSFSVIFLNISPTVKISLEKIKAALRENKIEVDKFLVRKRKSAYPFKVAPLNEIAVEPLQEAILRALQADGITIDWNLIGKTDLKLSGQPF